jgi:hypothetical protein
VQYAWGESAFIPLRHVERLIDKLAHNSRHGDDPAQRCCAANGAVTIYHASVNDP